MSPLPERMADRWSRRPMLRPDQGQLYWHVLLGDHPDVRVLAEQAHRQLSGLPGLDLVPHKWLHMTILVAGRTDEIVGEQVDTMLTNARTLLTQAQPATVTLARVLYHPEAIAVEARPAEALTPLLETVQAATRTGTGRDGALAHVAWKPHVTLAYSNSVRPAAPVIAALGRELPACEITIDRVSLVLQDGPEYLWNWHPVAEVPIGPASVSQVDEA